MNAECGVRNITIAEWRVWITELKPEISEVVLPILHSEIRIPQSNIPQLYLLVEG